MLDKAKVFLHPLAEGGVRLEGKSGNEAKEITEKYKKSQEKLNKALDNAVFVYLSEMLADTKFDIDNQKDRDSMKRLLESNMAELDDPIKKQAFLDALSLLDELNAAFEGKISDDEEVIEDTQEEVRLLNSSIADLNNNKKTGTEFKNARKTRKYNKLSAKQDRIDDSQKDKTSQIIKLSQGADATITEEDASLLTSFVERGVLTGMNFKKGLRDMYIEATYPEYKTASKSERNTMRREANEWASKMKDSLKDNNLWDDAKKVNRTTKKEDRVEKRKQRKTKLNNAETSLTESQLLEMFETTAKMMGKDEFAETLHARLRAAGLSKEVPTWETMDELNTILEDSAYSTKIVSAIKEHVPYMTVSNLHDWLVGEESGTESEEDQRELDTCKDEVEKQHGDEIDAVLLAIDPNMTQREMARRRSAVSAMIAAGIMNVANKSTGMEIKGAAGGIGVTFSGIDRVIPIVSRISIGGGITDKGVPGFVVDFGKDIKWKSGGVHLDAGAVNFVIPFARIGVDQTINGAALRKNLEAKRAWKAGVYAEAAPGYLGAGINMGSDLMAGIDRQSQNIENGINNILGKELQAILDQNLDRNVKIDAVRSYLENKFTKADHKTLVAVAKHIVTGYEQGYTVEAIASTFAAAWRNEAIKDSRGKVDVHLEAGVGTLMTVPVLKAFIGLKIYKRSTMLQDRYDRDAKERSLSAFKGYKKFDNADVEDMTMGEKMTYWLGKEVNVSETDTTITLTAKGSSRAIYDMLDVYVKNPDEVKITDKEITFSKGSNVLMGKLITAHGQKQKIYIGYDREEDVEAAKFPVNEAIDGNPDLVSQEMSDVVESEESFTFDIQERLNIYADYFDRAKMKAIEATDQAQAKKYKYNAMCQDVITDINKYVRAADEAQWKEVVSSFNNLMKNIGGEALPVKAGDPRNEIMNQMLNTIAYSAKAWNLNVANPKKLSRKDLPKDIPTLVNRKGAIEAFKSGGYDLNKNAFDKLYATAKGEALFKQVTYPNAIAVVSYYRNVGPKKPMNITAITGFNAVNLAHSAKDNELFQDSSVDGKIQNKLVEDLIKNPEEFNAFKARVDAMLDKANVDNSDFTNEDYANLLRGQKVNGVTLNKTFFKAFNGPCVNEAIVMNLLGLRIERYTKQSADIYVGMEHVDNYQKAHSINIGVGAMYGRKPKAPEKPLVPGTGVSEPGAGTEPTIPSGPENPGTGTTNPNSGAAAEQPGNHGNGSPNGE